MNTTSNQELDILQKNKQDGFNYRERRHEEWDENYQFYRDKVTVNRLTQRQSVNLPLMKQTIRTLLKDVDDMPVLYFENLDSDKEAELFKNEYWKYTADINKLELQDIVDKRQVFLFGRSYDQWQVINGKVNISVQDPMDILVSRYTDPFNIHSSRFLIHTHIFVPLTVIEANKDYDKEAVDNLKRWHMGKQGLIKSASNAQMLIEKNKKMADMGLTDVYSPILSETYVELSLHFIYRKEKSDQNEQLYLYVEADDRTILLKKRLEDVIGETSDNFFQTHYPYVSWADDVERQDWYSDGIADIVRTPNKVLNSWFSQMVENRTLRNFGMHYYDSTNEGFMPNSFNPVPWGWYPVPGRPQDVIQKVDIPDLSDSLDEINFLITMLEKATGATATQQGMQSQRQITLGEVQLALGEAKERIKGMSKFYIPAWRERGLMFIKLLEASGNKLDAVKIYKKGRITDDIYSREISYNDWKSNEGYRCKVWSLEEKDALDQELLQKINAVKVNMPDNPKLDEIFKRKMLDFAGLKPEEINEVMAFEEQKKAMMFQAGVPGTNPVLPEQVSTPVQNKTT